MSWGEHLKTEWLHIKRAPIAFLGAVILAACVIWAAMEWAYRAQLNSANALNSDYALRLNGSSPAEAQMQLADLQQKVQRLESIYMAPLTPQQAQNLAVKLQALKPRYITMTYGGAESYSFAKSLDAAFRSVKWPSRFPLDQGIGGGAGIRIYITGDDDMPVVQAIRENVAETIELMEQRVKEEEGISIYVGFRRPPDN